MDILFQMSTAAEKYQVAEIGGEPCVAIADAADYLGVSIRTVHNLIDKREPQLESFQFAGRHSVTIASLEAEKLRRDAERDAAEQAGAAR